MPEGDSVWRASHKLDAALAGDVLRAVELRWPNLPAVELAGRTTMRVEPRGKNILHRIEGGWTLHTHLGMDGRWTRSTPQRMTPGRWNAPDVRAAVATPRSVCLGHALRMVRLWPTRDERAHLGHLGPDVLGSDWDLDLAVRNVAAHPTTIAAALLEQRNLAGVGTMWAAEGLFAQRIHPFTPARDLPGDTIAELLTWIQRHMRRSCASDIPSSTGSTHAGRATNVHGRSGRPCHRCGTTLRVAMDGPAGHERTMFYCPTCQGGLAPNDDGRPMRPLGSRGG